MTRILVTGSRQWVDAGLVSFTLGWVLGGFQARGVREHPVLVHGAARGADQLAAQIWTTYGLPDEPHPADWDAHGRRAGFLRNAEMVALGADLCLAFIKDESPGATMCARLAKEAGIRTLVYRDNRDWTPLLPYRP